MSQNTPGNDAPLALSDLIRQHCQRTGDSYADIARAAGLSKARIGQLALTETPAMPRHETIVKLSNALRLPLRVVQSAAMVTAGVSPQETSADDRIALIAAHLAELDEVALHHVELFVGVLAAEAARG